MADNTITLIGTIGIEPELRTTSQGADVLNFTMATTERMRTGDGKWVDGATSWFRVAAWGTLGRNAHASLHKGQRVVVHGSLRITDYRTESGAKSSRPEVRALAVGHDLTFGTSAFDRAGGQVAAQQQDRQQPEPAAIEDAVEPPAPARSEWANPADELVVAPF